MLGTQNQIWTAFIVCGIATMLAGLLPLLPPAALAQYVALGVLMLYGAGIGLAATSPTVVELLVDIEEWADRRLGRS